MNIHVARTPHFRTGSTHTCCQGQTGSLAVRPDTARWLAITLYLIFCETRPRPPLFSPSWLIQ